MTDQTKELLPRMAEKLPIVVKVCADLDDECPDVRCKLTCYLYQPERGICPFIAGEKN